MGNKLSMLTTPNEYFSIQFIKRIALLLLLKISIGREIFIAKETPLSVSEKGLFGGLHLCKSLIICNVANNMFWD